MGLGSSPTSTVSPSPLGGRPKSSGAKSSGSAAAAEEPKPAVATSGGGAFNPLNGLIICSSGDFVCGVVPNIGASAPKPAADAASKGTGGMGHLSYSSDGSIPRAITFITTRVNGGTPAS